MKRAEAFLLAVSVAAVATAMSPRAAIAGPDGSIDATFNAPKSYALLAATTHHVDGVPAVVDVLSQPDGKVVVVGNAALPFETQHGTRYSNSIVVRRLLPGGGVDTGSGTGGVATIASPYQGDEYYQATAATLDSSGRIAIAGFAADNNLPRQSMAMWVLTATGQRDAGFGSQGMRVFDRGKDWSLDRASDIVAFTPHEWSTILYEFYGFAVAGEIRDDLSPADYESNPGPRYGMVSFAEPDGGDLYCAATICKNIQPPITNPACTENPLSSIAARVDTTWAFGVRVLVYAAGNMVCPGATYTYVFRMSGSSGFINGDGAFGANGVSYFSSVGGISPHGTSLAIDASSRPVVADVARVDGGWNAIRVTRLTTAGQYDVSFDSDGTRAVRFSNSPETTPSRVNVAGVLIQRDGRIIVGGDVEQRYAPGVFFTMRMNGDGSCDNDWHARFTLSYMSGTPPVRTWVDCAGWYYSPAEDYVQSDEISVGAMTFTEGERLLLAGSIPKRGLGASGDWALVQRYDNDGIFADGFGW